MGSDPRRDPVTRVAAFGALGVALVALGFALPNKQTSVGETSCSRLVQSYLAQAALDGGIRIVGERVQACRQDGNTAVARVNLEIEQTVFDPFTGRLSKERSRIVVVLKFAKSPWTVQSARAVG